LGSASGSRNVWSNDGRQVAEEAKTLGEERDAAVTLHRELLDQLAATDKDHALKNEDLQVGESLWLAYKVIFIVPRLFCCLICHRLGRRILLQSPDVFREYTVYPPVSGHLIRGGS
jgi:hypothetical protein